MSEGYAECQESNFGVGGSMVNSHGGSGESGAGGADIIEDEHIFAIDLVGIMESEDALGVFDTFFERKESLGAVATDSAEVGCHGQVGDCRDASSDFDSLVVSASRLLEEMHGDG